MGRELSHSARSCAGQPHDNPAHRRSAGSEKPLPTENPQAGGIVWLLLPALGLAGLFFPSAVSVVVNSPA